MNHIIKKNLFKPVIEVFVSNGSRYNMLNSAVLDLFHYIWKENLKTLVKYVIDSFWHQLVKFENLEAVVCLKVKYDEKKGGRKMSGSDNININSRSNMAGESVGGGRTLLDEFGSFEKGGFFDLGHPLLNRITESFIKAAGIGAVQAVSREAFFTALEGSDGGGDVTAPKSSHNNRFPNLRGETNGSSIEALVKNTGKESMQWGLAAGMYSGLTYGLKEARGTHDWKNSAVAGAVTGAVVALTSRGSENTNQDQVVQSAITGAALSTAANLLSGIF